MTNTNAQGYAYVEEARPIAFAKVSNGVGYFDVALHKTKNGKAIRLLSKTGDKVHVALDKVDDLIAKLKDVKAKGAATSIEAVKFA